MNNLKQTEARNACAESTKKDGKGGCTVGGNHVTDCICSHARLKVLLVIGERYCKRFGSVMCLYDMSFER